MGYLFSKTKTIAMVAMAVILAVLPLSPAAAAVREGNLFTYGEYVPGHSLYSVDGYGDLLYYDDGNGFAHIVRVSIPEGTSADTHPDNPAALGPIAERSFTEIGTYNFQSDISWSGNGRAEFYVDGSYIYYGPVGGIESWLKNPDGTFGPYQGKLDIPAPNKGETLAYDVTSGTWYSSTSSRTIYSFRVGVDTEWQNEFTYTSYGGGQGYHGGLDFVGGYLWVSELKTDYLGQWQRVVAGDGSARWVEVNRFRYNRPEQNVKGLGFGPLGHFWATGGGWKVKQTPPSLYEIGGGPVQVSASFGWSPVPAEEGSPVSFNDASNVWPDTIVSLDWSFGDGNVGQEQNPTHTYGDNGLYQVSLTVTTSNGYQVAGGQNVPVENLAPVLSAVPDRTGNEGTSLKFTAPANDPGSDDLIFTWNWGDGTPSTVKTYFNNGETPDPYPSSPGIYPFLATDTSWHAYGDNGVYTVTVTVADDDGAQTSTSLTVTVLNVAPVVNAGPDRAADEGEIVTLTSSFTDPSWLDEHSAVINWGDGTTVPGVVTLADTGGSVSGSHVYNYRGTYSVKVTVIDDDGAAGSDTLTVFVPLGMTVTVSPEQAPAPADAQYIYLGDIPLYNIPLQNIPLQDIPLQDISIGDTPLQDIPLQDIPLQDISWESILLDTPLQDIPLQDITIGELLLSGIPLQDITLADIFLAGTPLQDIPLQDIPLQDILLQDIDIAGTPLQDIPLQDIPLQDIPLQDIAWYSTLLGTPLQDIPLQDITLLDLVLNDIPLRYVSLADTPLQDIPLQDIPLQDIGFLLGTPLQNIPLQDITLADIVLAGIPLQDITINGVPLQDIPLQDIPLQDISWESILLDTPLQDIPLQDITIGELVLASTPLQDITLNSTPLQDIPLQDIPLQDISWESILLDTPLQDIPLQDITIGDLVLAGIPLQDIPLQDIPLQDITINGVPLQDIPLQDIPLQDISWESILLGTPLQDIPLQDITIGELLLSGIPLQDITFQDILLGRVPLQDITLFDLFLAFIPLQDIPWESIPLGSIPLPDLLIKQNSVTYTVNLSNNDGIDLENVVITHTLPDGFTYLAGSTTGDTTADPLIEGQGLSWGPFAVPAGTGLTLNFRAVVSTTLGTYYSQVSATGSQEIPPVVDTAPVTVIDSFENNDTWEQAAEIAENQFYISYISHENDIDWYKLPVPVAKGSMITVYLSHLPADYDLVLFAGVETLPTDIPLQSTPLQDIPLQDIPLQDIPLQDIPLQDIPLQDIPLQDIPLQDIPLQDIPLQDISLERGSVDEVAGDKVVNESGYYYILVSGYNDASSDEPYLLRVEITPPPPIQQISRDLPPAGSAGVEYAPYGAGAETLIITNEQRLGQYFPAETPGLMTRLRELADLDNVKGLILPVDSDVAVRNAYTNWDSNAGDPEAANTVAAAIRALVNSTLTSHPEIRYVVIAGSDELVPFRRVPDEVYLSNESTYAAFAHLEPGALQASLAHGYILTDDYYVDLAPVPWMGRELYLPDYANGRLVETPDEMTAIVDRFIASNGVLQADTALVTGYDFLSDGASRIASDLLEQGYAVEPLINETWSEADVAALLLADPSYDLTSLNAHFNHWQFGPAAGGRFDSSQILVSYLDGKLVFSMGCHSGLNVDDTVSEPGDWSLDFPQAFARESAWYIGNTGYGYGDSDIVALSEELMGNFARALGDAESVPVGQALLNAKQRYFLTMGSYGPFDEKVMIEATLYGLPMYRVQGVSGARPPAVSGQPLAVEANRLVDFGLVDSLTGEAQLVLNTNPDGAFYSADGETQFIPYRPIEPWLGMEIAYSGETAHGALFTAGNYTNYYNFNPVISRPTEDNLLGLYEPQIINEAWYPAKMQSIMSLETADGLSQTLAIIPGQFITTSAEPTVTGTQRLYTGLSYDIYYSTSADYAAPIIELVDINIRGITAPFTASFSVAARDADTAAIPDDGVVRRVAVTWSYTTGDTSWRTIDLTYDSASDRWVGELPDLTGEPADFIVQAVDGAGNVGLSASKGFFFTPIPVEAGSDQSVLEGDAVSLLGEIGAVGGSLSIRWDFGDGGSVQGVLDPTHVYNDNGNYTATLRVTDGQGGSGWDTLNVSVGNVAPAVTAPASATIQYGQPLALTGSFTDPGLADIHTYRWDFRDAEGNTLVTIWGNLNTTIHWLNWLSDYPLPGNYTATLTVTDDDGGSGSATTLVTITRLDTTTVVSSSVNPSMLNQEVTFTATIDIAQPVVGLTASPTGNITFSDGATVLATIPVTTSNGTTSTVFSTTLLPVGSHTITATYNGDSRFRDSSGSLTQMVLYRFGEILQPVPDPVSEFNGGSNIPIKFTVLDFNNAIVETALAEISVNGGPVVGIATYDSSGNFYSYNLSTKGLPLGLTTITVSLDDGTNHDIIVRLK